MRRRLFRNLGNSEQFLVANYKFNEASGTTVIDSAGTNNGTSTDVTVNQVGKLGTAYQYSLNTSRVEIPHSTDFDFTDGTKDLPFSISTWVKMDTVKNTFLIGKSNGTSRSWELIYESGLKFRMSSEGSAANRVEKTSGVFTAGQWYHIMITFDGSQGSNLDVLNGMKFYVNNGLQLTQSSYGTYSKLIQDTSPVWIGKFPTLTSYTLNGLMEETEIYKNHVLTEAERAALWNDGNGRSL